MDEVSRRVALSKVIKSWMASRKDRTITKLERMTEIPRKTLTAAADGSADVNVFYVQVIVNAILSPKEVFIFYTRYIPEALKFLQALEEGKAKCLYKDKFTEVECKIIIEAAFGETPYEEYLMRGNKIELDAIENLKIQDFVTNSSTHLKLTSKVCMTHGPAIDSLLKFCAARFDSSKEENSAAMFLGNCDLNTKNRIVAWKAKSEAELMEIISDYKEGPYKMSAFVFSSKMEDRL